MALVLFPKGCAGTHPRCHSAKYSFPLSPAEAEADPRLLSFDPYHHVLEEPGCYIQFSKFALEKQAVPGALNRQKAC